MQELVFDDESEKKLKRTRNVICCLWIITATILAIVIISLFVDNSRLRRQLGECNSSIFEQGAQIAPTVRGTDWEWLQAFYGSPFSFPCSGDKDCKQLICTLYKRMIEENDLANPWLCIELSSITNCE